MKAVADCDGRNDYAMPRSTISHRNELPSYVPPRPDLNIAKWIDENHSCGVCLILVIICIFSHSQSETATGESHSSSTQTQDEEAEEEEEEEEEFDQPGEDDQDADLQVFSRSILCYLFPSRSIQ